MTRSVDNRWLHRFAVMTAAIGLCLICVGGLVTSHGVGMSVPDWPTTYGYNMFFFPFSKWIGGIFYEHSHRLLASGVGFLTIILAVWLGVKEQRRWLRWLGAAALVAVILQGILGGLRVTWMKDELGIFHAALAQLYFALLCAIALFTSRWWNHNGSNSSREGLESRLQPADALNVPMASGEPVRFDRLKPGLQTLAGYHERFVIMRRLAVAATLLIFGQLVVGATMRHQHAGLAIPDFPLAYGRIWPATDADSIQRYNALRIETTAVNPITPVQIILQMVHRLGAVAILAAVATVAWFARRRLQAVRLFRRLATGWLLLVVAQAFLGAATIWTNKSADIATAHVAVGALSLVNGVMLILVTSRYLWQNSVAEPNFSAAFSHRVVREGEIRVAV